MIMEVMLVTFQLTTTTIYDDVSNETRFSFVHLFYPPFHVALRYLADLLIIDLPAIVIEYSKRVHITSMPSIL